MIERQLKIAYLIDDLSLGGAQKQLSMLSRALPASIRPFVVCLSHIDQPMGEALEGAGIEVVTIERRSHLEARRLLEVVRALRARDPDVVHGFLDAADGYAFVCARLLRKPAVLSVRSDSLRLSGAKKAALSWMLRHADRVLVNSRKGAAFLKNRIGVSDSRILHLPNWIDAESIGPSRNVPSPDAPPTLGFIGRFAPEKRIGLLVEVFHRLLAKVPEARLVLMGEGSERAAVARLVGELNLGERVEFVPPSPVVDGTLRRFHVLAMTSGQEGLPNAAIEALAAGVPIVSSNAGDIGDLVVEGETGVLFESEDVESMAETLARALGNRSLLENAVVAGPRLVREKFSLGRAVSELAAMYRALTR